MGRFYLDTEFTNGNYYLADIIEIGKCKRISQLRASAIYGMLIRNNRSLFSGISPAVTLNNTTKHILNLGEENIQ